MDVPTSEGSSGCESSWTMYLNQLSSSTNDQSKGPSSSLLLLRVDNNNYDQEEDEDLSMMSDASSGPPPLNCGDYAAVAAVSEDGNKGRKEGSKSKEKQQHSLCLDDTASSPILYFSQDNAAPNSKKQISATHFDEREPLPSKHFTLLKSSAKENPGNFLGKKRQ